MTGQMRDRFEWALKHARKVKEDHVRSVKGRRGQTDVLTIVEAWRGVEVIATAFLPPDRDRMLYVAQLWAGGLGADTVVITVESYFTAQVGQAVNPDTGKKWGPNELGDYFEKHGGQDNGVVSEGLLVSAFNRAGDDLCQSLAYRIVGRDVEWADSEAMPIRFGGIIPDELRRYMREATVLQSAARLGFRGSGPEEETAIADAMTIKMLVEAPGPPVMVMTFAVPGSVRHRVLRESLGRSAVQDPREWN